jgi:hypothetical protein
LQKGRKDIKTMHGSHTVCDLGQTLVTIRALSSLTSQNAHTIARTIAALDDGWSVQTWDDYDGYLSILIEPPDQATAQPSYVISGTIQRIELAKLRGDELITLGAFDSVCSAVDQLVRACKPTNELSWVYRLRDWLSGPGPWAASLMPGLSLFQLRPVKAGCVRSRRG